MSSFYLFVYGTLKRGGVRHPPLASQRFLGEARTLPHYLLYDLGDYPGLVAASVQGRAIEGELYEVDADLLPLLDRLEGSPDWFRLEPIALDGAIGPAFAYFYQLATTDRKRCESNRWDNPLNRAEPL